MTVKIHQRDGTKRIISGGIQSIVIDIPNTTVAIISQGVPVEQFHNVVTCVVERGWHEREKL